MELKFKIHLTNWRNGLKSSRQCQTKMGEKCDSDEEELS